MNFSVKAAGGKNYGSLQQSQFRKETLRPPVLEEMSHSAISIGDGQRFSVELLIIDINCLMTLKEQLITELDGVPEPIMAEVLNFLQFLKTKSANHAHEQLTTSSHAVTEASATAVQPHATDTAPIIKAIYTDGACSGNPGPGGWGVVLYLADGSVHELGGAAPQTTNNRMEMQAAIAGLQTLAALGQTTPVELLTDSEYVKKGITQWISGWKRRGWQTSAKKTVLNKDLWQELDRLNQTAEQQTGAPIQWTYVRGHAGNAGNERCDEIARAFSQNQTIALHQHSQITELIN
ncbi:MAG: ribonuclease HI [Cyanobacteria bacterium P01_D01_bin.6]